MQNSKFKPDNNVRYTIDDLIKVMACLRDPQAGCPWDIEQNFDTIAPYTIEEAYEVADAIARNDMDNLREELGDLLLQPIYHAQMAAEQNIFDISDVIHDITAKMVRRHPHVFGDKNAQNPDDVNKIWDENKDLEQKTKKNSQKSAIDGVPIALPALVRAQKLQKKAAKTGFEWKSAEGALDKLEEEIAEMREALKAGTKQDKTEELGDVLFALANLARMLDIDSEDALRKCNDKFYNRFSGMEDDIKETDYKVLSDTPLDEMIRIWNNQKQKTK